MTTINTYAVIGSTGNCGTALIQNLRKKNGVRIHAYCRNSSKLLRLIPEIADEKEKIRVFEGSIENVELVESCVGDCQAVFLVVSTNDNIPGCRIAQDATASVLQALQRRRHSGETAMPKLILLSSATIDDHLTRDMPSLLRWILNCSAYHVYQDIMEAERMIRAQSDWITGVFIKPGALSIDVQRGHALSLTDQDSPLSYLDLAGAMIEAADDGQGTYSNANVGVKNVNGKAKFPSGTPMCILVGLISYFFPVLHPYLPKGTGPR